MPGEIGKHRFEGYWCIGVASTWGGTLSFVLPQLDLGGQLVVRLSDQYLQCLWFRFGLCGFVGEGYIHIWFENLGGLCGPVGTESMVLGCLSDEFGAETT